MSSRRALLRHLWAMVQTRTEAAFLVVQLQRSAVGEGLLYFGIAAIAAMSFVIAAVVLIAVAVPAPWNAVVLGVLAAALFAATVVGVNRGNARVKRDATLFADFARGLKLDLAMVNLALRDPDTDDEEKLAARERAKDAVREAAVDKAATPSGAEGPDRPAPGGPAMESATAAMRAAAPAPDRPLAGGDYASGTEPVGVPDGVTEREMPAGTPPESMVGMTQADKERLHGSP